MAERKLEDLTLRDMLLDAEQLVRELVEHLEQSVIPKLRAADELVRSFDNPTERNEIADSTVRSSMARLLESDGFSRTLVERLEKYLTAIEREARQAVISR
jgi:hypothetical protein